MRNLLIEYVAWYNEHQENKDFHIELDSIDDFLMDSGRHKEAPSREDGGLTFCKCVTPEPKQNKLEQWYCAKCEKFL